MSFQGEPWATTSLPKLFQRVLQQRQRTPLSLNVTQNHLDESVLKKCPDLSGWELYCFPQGFRS
jgi:hypothetical protein